MIWQALAFTLRARLLSELLQNGGRRAGVVEEANASILIAHKLVSTNSVWSNCGYRWNNVEQLEIGGRSKRW